MIPKQYKDETDYRKIPREYLDSNVPKGRGFVKWLAFKTIPEQYQQIERYMENQNKAERPSLLDNQLNVLNEKVNWKKFFKEKAIVTYWKQDYYYQHEAYIKTVDTFNQVIIISNEDGNETMEIPMKNIQDIE
ncbi:MULTISPECIES: YolD-like family protein [Bacilli]|uniref:YolD-like family protein n=1 Tax=Bacilli TaxID=91061 RepID=UPI00066DD47B|nr:YolD-like family protein [Staphylococcus epidermidis]MBF2205090.1 YolD-like family protein [Staphylococcus epidermidis]MBF2209505.1 YolD-like family protein [Staphylococcus epidermidis]MBF2211739.1 YolD-like family protein [Staphylococcus epidermidis]MBM0783745.1 YolD-like family protein [Staphylococcus epidermidis]MBM0813750.1 YolD-like family protein [Staphylococcus epidermidis]